MRDSGFYIVDCYCSPETKFHANYIGVHLLNYFNGFSVCIYECFFWLFNELLGKKFTLEKTSSTTLL